LENTMKNVRKLAVPKRIRGKLRAGGRVNFLPQGRLRKAGNIRGLLMIDLEGKSEAEVEACAALVSRLLKVNVEHNPSIDCYQVDGTYRYDVPEKPETVSLAS